MKRKNQSFAQALRHASRGLFFGFLFEANLRRQLVVVVLVIILGLFLTLTPWQWIALSLAAVFVVTLELINSALEALADAVHPDWSEHIQRSKDLSAAAVLLASGMAFCVGLAIFLPALAALVR